MLVLEEFVRNSRSSGWTTLALVVFGIDWEEFDLRFIRVDGVAGAEDELEVVPKLVFEAFRDGGGITISGKPLSSFRDDFRVGGLGLIMGDTFDTREDASTGVVDLFPRSRDPATFELLLLAAVDGSCWLCCWW